MATNIVTTSFVVSFGSSSSSGILKAEVDDRPAGQNGGKTQFMPGDNVGFLVFKSDNVDILAKMASWGLITEGAASVKDVEQVLTFANVAEQSLSYPVGATGIGTPEWYGTDLGGLVMVGDSTIRCSAITGSSDPALIKVGTCKIKYQSPCVEYMLSNTLLPQKIYDIVVFLLGQQN